MRIVTAFLLVVLWIGAAAQHDKVLEIRAHYKAIKVWANCTDPDSLAYSGHYSDQIIRNVNDAPWRAVGIMHDTITLWFSDVMEAENAEGNTENDRAWALELVTRSSQYSLMFQYQEWLFYEGKLIFYYDRFDGYDEESTYEYRYYFDNNKLIRFMNGSQIIGFDESIDPILETGDSMKALFLMFE